MSPGEFNQKWSELTKRLLGDEAPIVKLGALCSFLTISRYTFEPRDQWGQKVKLIFVDAQPRTVRSLFTTHQLLNFSPNQLAELSGMLDDVVELEPSARDLLGKVIVARVLQLLFVGRLPDAAKLLGIELQEVRAATNVDRAFALVVAMQSHHLVSHILPFIEQWKQDSRQGQFKSTEVQVLLYAPEHTGWHGHGVLSQLSYHSSLPDSQDNLLSIPASSLVAVKAWLKRKGTFLATLCAELSCEDVRGDVSGQSHSLAAAALVAASVEESTSSWERVGFSTLLAITGEIDDEGWVRPVENLEAKITRAFYSPLSVVSVPSQQRREAELVVDRLKESAPTRELKILPIWNLSDILDPPVVGLRRKLDPVKWIMRRGTLVSKAIFVVASLLMLIGALQLTIYLYPKLNLGFDWQPEFWDVRDGEHVILFNTAGQTIARATLPVRWAPTPQVHPQYTNTFTYHDIMAGQDSAASNFLRAYNSAQENCRIADVNGDGRKEILFNCLPIAGTDTVWSRRIIFCLTLADGPLWFMKEYQLLWQREYERGDFAPMVGEPANYPAEAAYLVAVDWLGDGHANPIIGLTDGRMANNSLCYLEELDGETGEQLGRFYHKQWFFGMSAIADPVTKHETLWAGAIGHTTWSPELFTFQDSVCSRVWPCADTSGLRVLRYPACDVGIAYGVPTHFGQIQQHKGREWEVALTVRSTQLKVKGLFSWRGYIFRVRQDGSWIGDSFDLSYGTDLREFEQRGKIKLPIDMDGDWLAPLTFAELWTGSSWIPADTTRPKPDPYPIYERNDPRWRDTLKYPVRWQEM